MTTISPDIERLARRVGARTGRTVEQVIREAVEAQARNAGIDVAAPARKEIDLDRVREITHRVASRPLLDKRTPKEIIHHVWGGAAIPSA